MASTEKSVKLTKAQAARLVTIARYVPTSQWPNAAFWGGRTDDSLVSRGLIERCDVKRPLVNGLMATWRLCRLTAAGRLALAQSEGE